MSSLICNSRVVAVGVIEKVKDGFLVGDVLFPHTVFEGSTLLDEEPPHAAVWAFVDGRFLEVTNPPPDPSIQKTINAESQAYLNSTDWYVIRMAETGVPVPQDILDARQAARVAIQ